MSHIPTKLQTFVMAERREAVAAGNEGSNTETNTRGNGGSVTGNGESVTGNGESVTGNGGPANGGNVVGENQSGGGNNSKSNIGGAGGAGGSIGGSANGGGVTRTDGVPPATLATNSNSNSLAPHHTVSRINSSSPPTSPFVSSIPITSSTSPTSSLPLSSTSAKLVSNSLTESSIPAPSASASLSNIKPSPSLTSLNNPISHSNKGGLIGGIVGGLISLLILTVFLVYYFIRRRFRGSKKDSPNRITAFDASQYQNIEPMSFPPDIKLRSSPALLPDSSSINSPIPYTIGSSDSLVSVNMEAQRNTTANKSAIQNASPPSTKGVNGRPVNIPSQSTITTGTPTVNFHPI